LSIGIRLGPSAFQLDTQAETIAASTLHPSRLTSMPSRPIKGHELLDITLPINKQMGGNTNACQLSKARVLTTVQRTGEKARWCAGTKFAYW
jgi:hypothetical protein